MRKKKIFFAGLLIVSILASQGAYNKPGLCPQASIQNKINNAQQELNSLKNRYNATDNAISDVQKKKQEMEAAVKELDDQLSEAVSKYNTLLSRQETLESEIAEAEVQLEAATEKENDQYDNMKLRIQYMYEVGDQSYLEILLTSKNIVEFINNVTYIVELSLYDRQMLTSYQETKQQIADNKALLEKDRIELTGLVADAKQQSDAIEEMIESKNVQVERYKTEIAKLEGQKEDYQAEIDERNRIIAALEKEAAEAIAAAQQPANNAGTEESPANNSNQYTSSSGFIWPCPASRYITDDYGYRYYKGYTFHSGIDIAASMGSSIIAAGSGTVASAGYNASMGNYVMIAHGNGIVTVYMHASALLVSSGQTVSAGQQIALVGSTGDSTGPHLHFSVRANGVYVNPWDYL